MTPPKDQAPGLVARLRDKSKTAAWFPITAEAADLIEQQAARIAELEEALQNMTGLFSADFMLRRGADVHAAIALSHHALALKTLHDTRPHHGLIREQWKPEDESYSPSLAPKLPEGKPIPRDE